MQRAKLSRAKPVYNKQVSVVPRLFETNKLCLARLPFRPCSCQNAWVLGCLLTGAALRFILFVFEKFTGNKKTCPFQSVVLGYSKCMPHAPYNSSDRMGRGLANSMAWPRLTVRKMPLRKWFGVSRLKVWKNVPLVVNALPSECLTQKKKYNSIGILFSQAHQYFVMYHSNSHERSAFKHPFFCCQVFFGSSNNQELHLHPMQVKGTFRPLGSSSKLLIPERFWIEATLGTRHFDCLCMKIWCFKGQLKSFNFQCLEFQSNFNTVQLCSTIQLINLHNMFFNQLVQCTISLLLSTRTQLHQQDAIVSPCGLQNHSRWIPVGDSIEIELPNLWHNEINKLQVIWVCQRNLEDWWRFFGDLSGAKRDQWYLINYEYFSVLSELSRHSKVPAE